MRRLKLLFAQWSLVPWPFLILSGAAASLVQDYARPPLVYGWLAINSAVPFLRQWASVRWFGGEAAIRLRWRAANVFAYASVLSGITVAAAAPMFFPGLPIERQALLGYLLLGTTAGAVAASGPFPPAFFAYVIPVTVSLIWAWIAEGVPAVGWLVTLLLLVFAVLSNFVIDNGKVVAESFRIRFERESLLREKEELIDRLQVATELAETARRRAEEASLSKSRFLAAASHDLRQPLHSLSLLSALLSDTAREPRTAAIARNMDGAVRSLDKLFSALLDLSKLDAGVIVPVYADVRLDRMLALLAAEYRYKAAEKHLVLDLEAPPLAARTDPILLERIVRNLLENAVRYTEHGRITLSAGRREEDVWVEVRDTGIGIPAAEHARVFDEFYQIGNPERSHDKGLGIGLAVVRRLSTLIAADVRLHSAVGEGASFMVSLRGVAVALAAAGAGDGQAEERTVNVNGACVLVIDDDEGVREALRLTLDEWGCASLVAAGLEEARKAIDASQRMPDVMITDLRLAGGASGLDAIAALRREYGIGPALIITGETSSDRLIELNRLGDPVLHKPVHYTVLKNWIRDLLPQAQTG